MLQSIDTLEHASACSADDVEAVLLWQEPRRSSKVFLGGMYILICMRQLVLGTCHALKSTAILQQVAWPTCTSAALQLEHQKLSSSCPTPL